MSIYMWKKCTYKPTYRWLGVIFSTCLVTYVRSGTPSIIGVEHLLRQEGDLSGCEGGLSGRQSRFWGGFGWVAGLWEAPGDGEGNWRLALQVVNYLLRLFGGGVGVFRCGPKSIPSHLRIRIRIGVGDIGGGGLHHHLLRWWSTVAASAPPISPTQCSSVISTHRIRTLMCVYGVYFF